MKGRFALIIGLAFFTVANAAKLDCSNKANVPSMVKRMDNWDIIATNVATIIMTKVFSGNELTYSVSAHPKNAKNKVTIQNKTGIVRVKAVHKDNFDITVTATNSCGAIADTFNVIIDEEE
jgi:hypothetical protein